MSSTRNRTRQSERSTPRRSHAPFSDFDATLNAIYRGEVDGLAVHGPEGSRFFTLATPEEPFLILAERLSEGVATLTTDGAILFCNRRFADITGRPSEQLLGSSFPALLPDTDRAAFSSWAWQALRKDLRVESCLLRTHADPLPVQLSLSSLVVAESAQGICLVATDLSDRKRAEQELHARSEREAAMKDQLLSHVSHELRSPLACVHQFTTILLDGLSGPITADQKEALDIILKSVNQLCTMIDDLLEAGRIDAGKLRIECDCVHLQDIIREAVEMLRTTAAQSHIRLVYQPHSDPLFVYADSHRVLQILLNLLGNALKFTSARGWVEVTCGLTPKRPGYAIVTVKDNGCGISKSAQPHIFERLYQEHDSVDHGHQGLGLGLAICKELVHCHQGEIWVNSRPRHGSTFSFTLPLYSLSQILAPALLENGSLRKAVSLITIRVSLKPASSTLQHRADLRRKCLELLQRCTLPDKDALLPPANTRSTLGRFAILAGTDAQGAQVLVRRIQDQFRRSAELPELSAPQISTEVLPVPSGPATALPDLEAVTHSLARAISKALNSGEPDEQS
jgi:PAS domain S-box-containing protein